MFKVINGHAGQIALPSVIYTAFHLRDTGELEPIPADIGQLMKMLQAHL